VDPFRVSELETTEFTPTNKPENGFSYFYYKRRVLDDRMSTIPLDLELCPAPTETEENDTEDSSEEDEHIDDATLIQWMENQFESEDEMS
jgi:hypothetical protein